LTNQNLAVWGPGWSKINNNEESNIVIRDEKLNYNIWVKIYNAAKIVLMIHFQDRSVPCFQASPKVFETLSCGCFMLVDRQKDVFSLFKDGEHLVGYEDLNDLKEKIQYYLGNPSECERIAAQGRKEVLSKHTFVHRIKELLSVCVL
jgi:spore maturation protein CgeB